MVDNFWCVGGVLHISSNLCSSSQEDSEEESSVPYVPEEIEEETETESFEVASEFSSDYLVYLSTLDAGSDTYLSQEQFDSLMSGQTETNHLLGTVCILVMTIIIGLALYKLCKWFFNLFKF